MPKLDKHIKGSDPEASHPEAYTAPTQIAAEDEVADLLRSLVYLVKPDYVLETGTAYGHTARAIGDALVGNGFGVLHTLELERNRAKQAEARIGTHRVELFVADWKTWTPPDDTIYRLCFFDASRHERDKEFEHFEPWIHPRAVMVFHDCAPHHPGLEGVERLRVAGKIEYIYIPTPRGIAIATKVPS